MTPDEEKMVLNWLRIREDPVIIGGLFDNGTLGVERHILQRALRNDEPISREIRDAMADWIQTAEVTKDWKIY